MFSCVWLHFKKCFGTYFLIFGCVLENTIENTFSTYCSYFLTFSRLPNEYIISFIPQITNKIQTKIVKSGQTKARSRSKLRVIAIAIDADRRGVQNNRDRRQSARCLDRSLSRCICSLSVVCCLLAECVSLFCACYGNCLKVKQLCKMISWSTSVNFGQMEIIFRKIYFLQLPNAWVLRKMISGNDFQPIQTQPQLNL